MQRFFPARLRISFALFALIFLPAGLALSAAAQQPPASTGQTEQPAPATPQDKPSPDAQQPAAGNTAAQNPDGSFSLRTSVTEVNLIFTVTDKSGHFVKDLKQEDFNLLDNQKPPEQVFHFTQQTNLPLRVGLLIDASNSIRDRFRFEQQSAVDFFLQIIRPEQDKAFVMGFDVTPDMTQDYTSNVDLLATGVNKLHPGGGTALYDALYTACRDKLLPIRTAEPLRKAIVLLSDGDDNQSRAMENDAIKMCQRAETIVYTISTNISPTKERGDRVLEDISLATGGRSFAPQQLEDVHTAFIQIADELRSQYSVEYRPADFKTDGAFRSIYLTASDRHYKVRARRGYFAPRE